MEPLLAVLGMVVFYSILLIPSIKSLKKKSAYMKGQKEDNTDKREMLSLMEQVLEGEYEKYTYVVGYYVKIETGFLQTTYYHYPYILAFTQSELWIYSFVRRDGKLYLRNQLQVDWSAARFRYKLRRKEVTLQIRMIGETMPIRVNPVIESGGEEKSARPICVYQEKEYEALKGCLEGYRSLAKG